jgi:sigma-E factor negative regulatory protein RseC
MIEQDGRVLAVRGELAEVEGYRQSTCGGCAADGACGTSLLERFFGRRQPILTARNPIGARPGERVVLGVPEAALIEAAFVAYLLPLLAMIAGAIGGDYLAARLAPDLAGGIALLGAVSGLAAGLGWLARFSRRRGDDARYQPVILRRVATVAAEVTLRPRRTGVTPES